MVKLNDCGKRKEERLEEDEDLLRKRSRIYAEGMRNKEDVEKENEEGKRKEMQ